MIDDLSFTECGKDYTHIACQIKLKRYLSQKRLVDYRQICKCAFEKQFSFSWSQWMPITMYVGLKNLIFFI